MAMSVTMQRVHDLVARFDQSLLATDDRFSRTVTVEHQDGTRYHFENASACKITHPDFLCDQQKKAKEFCDSHDTSFMWSDGLHSPTIHRSEIGWLIVFTEHNGFHVFSCGDLENYAQYQRVTGFDEFPVEIT